MVFTKSLLIKALGGVTGVGGTTVGVLASTGVLKPENNTPVGAASGNKEGSSVEEVSRPQQSNDQSTNSPNPQSPGETSTITSHSTSPGTPENQGRNTTDGAGLGVGNLPSNPDSQQHPNEEHNSPNTLPSVNEGVENKSAGKTPEQEPKQPGTGSRDEQVSDPNNTQQGIQTTQDGQGVGGQQVNQDNGSDGSSVTPPTQGTADNSLGGGESVDSSRENVTDNVQKGQGDKTDDSTEGHETLQPVSKDSQLGSSGSSNSSPAPGAPAGQPTGDSVDSTPPGTSGTPGADGTPGSTPSNEPGTGGDGTTGGSSGSSDISTTDQATQSQSKEDKINAKLVELGLPKDKCNFVKDETTKTCQISEKELKKIKFEDSENDDDEGEASASEGKKIQLKIEILTGNKKTDYGLNDGDGDDSDVTKDLLFTLSGFDNEINVGHDSTTLYPNTNPEFKVGNDELEKLWGTHSDLTGKVGIKKEDNSYKFDSTQSLKYSSDSGENINTLNSPTTTGTISVSDNNSNYNLGIKVNFSATVTSSSGGSDSLEKGDYEIKYKDGENGGWYLSKVTQSEGGGQA